MANLLTFWKKKRETAKKTEQTKTNNDKKDNCDWETPKPLTQKLQPVLPLKKCMLPTPLADFAFDQAHSLDNSSAEYIAVSCIACA